MPVISAIGKAKAGDSLKSKVQDHPVLHNKLQASQVRTVRPCLPKRKNESSNNYNKRFVCFSFNFIMYHNHKGFIVWVCPSPHKSHCFFQHKTNLKLRTWYLKPKCQVRAIIPTSAKRDTRPCMYRPESETVCTFRRTT